MSSSLKEGVWSEHQTVKAHQIGPGYKMKPSTISEIFQEVAGNHSNAEKFGLREMMKNGHAWVLGSLKYEVKKWPKWTEDLHITTWVYDVQKLSSQRNFLIKDDKGNVIIQGSSIWFGIDLKRRRPIMITEFMDKVTQRDDLITLEKPSKLQPPSSKDFESKRKVVYSELDPVNHVNNIKYFDWMLDSIPHSFKSKKLVEVEINYLSEVVLDQEVDVITEQQQSENGYHLITGIYKEDKPACIIHTKWELI
ncbi:hypothetical protein MY04_0712 [Flammeovirga sp. MY04]|uniref:acyl-[acyl-carrier-protein] thioesterase n=1 Tax=Flammeovirga sp. MY04 TaxID=1191459 RepID=UPI000806364F|nr:acyl-ACP thioesterase domain-containing protein [Flammeovirga sp. MY04]ANQ48094.1 hypothetical protein MY04_0712 [Flammeovirga sp. MY04]